MDTSITWTSLRKEVQKKNISEIQFYTWLEKTDKGESEKETLQLITNHL